MTIQTPPRAPVGGAPSPGPARRRARTPREGRFDALLGPARLIVRFGGMVGKELNEIIRQPLLMLTLILGPFLVLALFGLGSTGQQPPVRTLLVVPNDGTFSTDRGAYKEALSTGVNLLGVTTDQEAAVSDLRAGRADVAVVLPSDIGNTITSGQQARVEILYNAIDPVKVNYIQYLAYVQIAELNRLTLRTAAEQGQGQASDLQQFTGDARRALDDAEREVRAGNARRAAEAAASLDQRAGPVQDSLLTAAQLMVGLAALADKPADQVGGAAPRQAAAGITSLRRNLTTFQQDLALGPSGQTQQVNDLQRLRADVDSLDQVARTVKSIPPAVVSAPFASDTKSITRLPPSTILYYGPAVLALLLQHIGVTFGSLSLVRERLLGATELFSVAPIRTIEILVGKYVAYTLVSLVVAAALMALMNLGLGVPVFGLDFRPEAATPILWGQLTPEQLRVFGYDAAVIVAMIAASLGIGFFISAISSSEYQAVQLSMLVLLASVFFGGLFLPLESIIVPIRYVGFALPVTYGIEALQTLMVRGLTTVTPQLGSLAAIAGGLFVLTALLARRQLTGR